MTPENGLTLNNRSLATISPQLSPWDDGVSSIDLAGTRLTNVDQAALKGTLTIIVGERNAKTAARATVLWQHIQDKGWSSERLDATLYAFQERKFYGLNWSLGDFFECSPENDLHDMEWLLSLSDADKARCEIWETPEKRCLYRFQGVGVDLPKEFVKVYPK